MANSDPLSMAAPKDVLNADRLAALDDYDIMDTSPEASFDDIVQLATLTCKVPVALASEKAEPRPEGRPECGVFFSKPCQGRDVTAASQRLAA